MNNPEKYSCPKCGSRNCSTGMIRTSGSLISSILNIQSKKFTTVVCNDCFYTELYSVPFRKIGEDLDLPERNKNFH